MWYMLPGPVISVACRSLSSVMSIRHILKLLFLCLYSVTAAAQVDVTLQDLPFLPKYCMGTQLIRNVSKDTTPMAVYMRLYGPEFHHLHHYCWALLEYQKASSAPDHPTDGEYPRSGWLNRSLEDLKYIIDRSGDNFIFLPDILTTNALVLNALGRKEQAIDSLKRAIRIRPDYLPAYVRLGDLYKAAGDRANAIRILETGLKAVPGTALIIHNLQELGVKPDPRYMHPAKDKHREAGADIVVPGSDAQARDEGQSGSGTRVRSSGSSDAGQDGQGSNSGNYGTTGNPYCRFCAD